MSRELTITWARRNCPDPRVAHDVSLRLDEAQGRHVYFMVGRNITRSKVAYLVISQRREMFAFELTPQQEKNFSSQPDALGTLIQAKHDEVESDAPDKPLFTISNLVIDSEVRQPKWMNANSLGKNGTASTPFLGIGQGGTPAFLAMRHSDSYACAIPFVARTRCA